MIKRREEIVKKRHNNEKLLQGNEAIVEGALRAGVSSLQVTLLHLQLKFQR